MGKVIKNPLLHPQKRSSYLLKTSLKLLIVLSIVVSSLFFIGCKNDQVQLPSFIQDDVKQTDFIDNSKIIKAVDLLRREKIDTLAFQVSVRDYEESFYYQTKHIREITPTFFQEMEVIFRTLFKKTESFSSKHQTDSSYLKKTLHRLCLYLLGRMELSTVSDILVDYYKELDVRSKDYLFEYNLTLIETIFASVQQVKVKKIPRTDLIKIKNNLSKTGSPFKRKEIKLGLRSLFLEIESLTFYISERLTTLENLRYEIRNSHELFLENDSSFELLTVIRTIKDIGWLNSVDYHYLLGNGYVKVLPTETYNVKQYGKLTSKQYKITSTTIMYKRSQDRWIEGSYELTNSLISIDVGRYVNELEVFMVAKDTYLIGSEILQKEK